jgi:hypothetical protein
VSNARQSIDIDITVTLPDDRVLDLSVMLAAELYQACEYPDLVQDTFARAARAVIVQLNAKEHR